MKELFKNEVEIKELKNPVFLKKISWEGKISVMTKFVKKLEEEDIKYAIQTNNKFKCQNIFIGKADEGQVRATIEY